MNKEQIKERLETLAWECKHFSNLNKSIVEKLQVLNLEIQDLIACNERIGNKSESLYRRIADEILGPEK